MIALMNSNSISDSICHRDLNMHNFQQLANSSAGMAQGTPVLDEQTGALVYIVSSSPPTLALRNVPRVQVMPLRSASMPSMPMFPTAVEPLLMTPEGVPKVPINRAALPHYYSKTPRCRRVSSELTRSYVCTEKECGRRYEAWRSLQHHLKVKHGIVRRKYDSDPAEDKHVDIHTPVTSHAAKSAEPSRSPMASSASPHSVRSRTNHSSLADVLSPLPDDMSLAQTFTPHMGQDNWYSPSFMQSPFAGYQQGVAPADAFGMGTADDVLHSASMPSFPNHLYDAFLKAEQSVPAHLREFPDDFEFTI